MKNLLHELRGQIETRLHSNKNPLSSEEVEEYLELLKLTELIFTEAFYPYRLKQEDCWDVVAEVASFLGHFKNWWEEVRKKFPEDKDLRTEIERYQKVIEEKEKELFKLKTLEEKRDELLARKAELEKCEARLKELKEIEERLRQKDLPGLKEEIRQLEAQIQGLGKRLSQEKEKRKALENEMAKISRELQSHLEANRFLSQCLLDKEIKKLEEQLLKWDEKLKEYIGREEI